MDQEEPEGTSDTGSTDTGSTDPGTPDDGTTEAGSNDDGSTDAADTGTTDDGTADAGSADTGATDTSSGDDGTSDAGSADTSATDTSSGDDGTSDAGSGDAGTTNDGTTDAGSADAGTTDVGSSGSADGGTTDDAAPSAGSSTGTGTPGDPGQPYLFVDLYSGVEKRLVGGHPGWTTLASTRGFFGAILKAWEGLTFNDGGWFARNWPSLRNAGAGRYGVSWFRGAYLFLDFAQSGADQADAYLQAIDGAGGWDVGDLLPIIDVEQGALPKPAVAATATTPARKAQPGNPNRNASAPQIIDCVTACADRLRQQTGRRVMLYGRGAMRDLSINNRMGCDVVWNPSWTTRMVRSGLEAWTLDEVVLWQYCGDGTATIPTLPHAIAGFGPTVDISVFVKGAQRPTLQLLRDNLLK